MIAVKPKQNSNWYVYNDSNTVFVFLHGFFSDSQKCWTNEDGTFWPDLVSTDPRLGNPAIFLAGYYTDLDSGNYKIADCASEVLAELRRPGLNGEEAVLEKDNIIFVCHSLGGIVARYMIERNRENFLTKAIGLVLLASPSYGSDYANKFSRLIKFYKNKIAAQLKYANESLQDLDDRFRSLIQQRIIPRLVGAEAVEHHPMFHWRFLPGFDPVVGKESASRYFGAGTLLPKTNHSTCVKPNGHSHVAHRFLATTFIDLFLPVSFPARTSPRGFPPIAPRTPNPLFEIYDAVDEPFYLKRNMDSDLNQKAQLFSVWLYGNSGVGKTACTRHEVFRRRRCAPVQVYIGSLSGGKADHVALLNEIYYTVCGVTGGDYASADSPRKIIEEIGAMLVERGVEQGIVLVIDEIPMLTEPAIELPKFLLSIIGLISQIKRLAGISHAGIILNSIFDPTEFITDPEMKIAEQIKFLPCHEWSKTEIIELVELISSNVGIEVDDSTRDHLIGASYGSPRFVKTFFKNILSKNVAA